MPEQASSPEAKARLVQCEQVTTLHCAGVYSGYRREAARSLPRATQPLERENVLLNLMVKPRRSNLMGFYRESRPPAPRRRPASFSASRCHLLGVGCRGVSTLKDYTNSMLV